MNCKQWCLPEGCILCSSLCYISYCFSIKNFNQVSIRILNKRYPFHFPCNKILKVYVWSISRGKFSWWCLQNSCIYHQHLYTTTYLKKIAFNSWEPDCQEIVQLYSLMAVQWHQQLNSSCMIPMATKHCNYVI